MTAPAPGAGFSVDYRFAPVAPDEKRVSPYLYSQGLLRLTVGGKNLCELAADAPREISSEQRAGLSDNLFPYVAWASEHFGDLFKDDPFPFSTEAQSAADFDRLSLAYLRGLKDEDPRLDEVFKTRQGWLRRHCFTIDTDGGYPPKIYFRKVAESVEVSWDSADVRPYRGLARYRYERGSEIVEASIFLPAFRSFILSFLEELRGRNPQLRSDADILAALDKMKGSERLQA